MRYLLLFCMVPLLAQNYREYKISTSGYHHVPEADLDGNSLLSLKWGFSMYAPKYNWVWKYQKDYNTTHFACVSPDDIAFVVTPIRSNRALLSERDIKRLLRDFAFRSGMPSSNNLEYTPSNIPIEGSHEIRYLVNEKANDPGMMYMYLAVANGHWYLFQHFDSASEDTDAFVNWVNSFYLTEEPDQVMPESVPSRKAPEYRISGMTRKGAITLLAPAYLIVIYFLIWLCTWGLSHLINQATNRNLNGHVIAFFLILTTVTVHAVGLGLFLKLAGFSFFDVLFFLGRSLTFGGIPLGVVHLVDKKRDELGFGVGDPMERAQREMARNRPEQSLQILSQAASGSDSPEIWHGYWEAALKMDSGNDLAVAGRKLVDLYLNDKQPAAAYRYWWEVNNRWSGKAFSLPSLCKLGKALHHSNCSAEAQAIVGLLPGVTQNASPTQLLQAIELAATMNHDVLHILTTQFLNNGLATQRHEQRFKQIMNGLESPVSPTMRVEPEENGTDREAVDQQRVLIDKRPGITELKRLNAKPVALSSTRLSINIGSNEKDLPLQSIKGIGAGVIKHKTDKPFLIIDLFLDDPALASDRHRIVRLDSRIYQVTELIADAQQAKDGFKLLMSMLVAGRDALYLPSKEHVLGKPFAFYDSVSDLEGANYHLKG